MLKCGSCVQTQYFQSKTLQTEKARGRLDQLDLGEEASKRSAVVTQCIADVGNDLAASILEVRMISCYFQHS